MTLASPELQRLRAQGAVTHVTPPRRAYSVRRTITTDVRYPEGETGGLAIEGHGRDLLTRDPAAMPEVITQESVQSFLQQDRTIVAIRATPEIAGLEAFVGRNTFQRFRAALHSELDVALLRTRPSFVLLDDLVGVSIIAGWTWLKWPYARTPAQTATQGHPPSDICIGYRSGSPILMTDYDQWDTVRVSLLPEGFGDDPWAFHALPADNPAEPCLRRARRMDVWQEQMIHVDAILQDSTNLPDGDRACMHEFALQAIIDPTDMTVREINAQGHAFPHENCFDAPASTRHIIGMPIAVLREQVLTRLRGPIGCTHVNDMMRMLSEVDILIAHLHAAK